MDEIQLLQLDPEALKLKLEQVKEQVDKELAKLEEAKKVSQSTFQKFIGPSCHPYYKLIESN